MSAPVIVELDNASPAAEAGLVLGDAVLSLNGQVPRDVIEWQRLVDEAELELEIERGGLQLTVDVAKRPGEPLGIQVDAALFDRVRTCDNHCDFCFIYQLPKGMRRTLYLKDDDYRLSFLYGNFTTLTRFTESDLERVITERLSPLYVSIHATDPDVRTHMLRNRRGAMSLRWLEAILDADIEVHGQIVCCPGVNDGVVLDQTLAGVPDRYPTLASIAVVPTITLAIIDPATLHSSAKGTSTVRSSRDLRYSLAKTTAAVTSPGARIISRSANKNTAAITQTGTVSGRRMIQAIDMASNRSGPVKPAGVSPRGRTAKKISVTERATKPIEKIQFPLFGSTIGRRQCSAR